MDINKMAEYYRNIIEKPKYNEETNKWEIYLFAYMEGYEPKYTLHTYNSFEEAMVQWKYWTNPTEKTLKDFSSNNIKKVKK